MKILKFGGASVKSAEGIKNLAHILDSVSENHIVVISAMGKMTNKFEELSLAYFKQDFSVQTIFEQIYKYHLNIIKDLFKDQDDIHSLYNNHTENLKTKLEIEPSLDYSYEYDQIVSYGEILSTTIVSAYLNKIGQENKWIDIRKGIKTDCTFREGKLNWKLSEELCNELFNFQNTFKYVTQGFIAGTTTNMTTSLGREGSDYTGAILANLLNADSLTIWKDVPGIMNADPKEYEDASILKYLSYRESIELAHFGAKVIHPKTIKPLENKNIPLFVRSFINPEEIGSIVGINSENSNLMPIYIHKRNQVLLSLSPRDLSFIGESELCTIVSLARKNNTKINLIQSSAISLSLCCDFKEELFSSFFDKLKKDFFILYNENKELITVRHFNEQSIKRVTKGKNILLEQRTRVTAHFVVDCID
ncbi:MAG: aspartate kinase [Marinifilaceae bacterium]